MRQFGMLVGLWALATPVLSFGVGSATSSPGVALTSEVTEQVVAGCVKGTPVMTTVCAGAGTPRTCPYAGDVCTGACEKDCSQQDMGAIGAGNPYDVSHTSAGSNCASASIETCGDGWWPGYCACQSPTTTGACGTFTEALNGCGV